MIILVWKQVGVPSDPMMYQGFSILHPLGKLLTLSYLHCLDAKTHCCGWLVEEQVGFHLGHHVENHQMLLI